jgi:long-chain acyl-CoA synthetase
LSVLKQHIIKAKPVDNFKQLINQSVKLFGDKEAFIAKKKNGDAPEYRHITYIELKNEIDSLGTALANLGLVDVPIALVGENRYEWCLGYLTVTCGGNVVVPIDKELKAEEIANLIKRSEAKAIIFSGKMTKVIEEFAKQSDIAEYLICMDDMEIDIEGKKCYTISQLIQEGQKLLDEGDTRYVDVEIDSNKVSVLLFTSGTTGIPKGVMLSQKNICFNIESVTQCLEYDYRDSALSILPLHHTYECTCGFLVMMYNGCRVAFCDGIRYIAKNINEYKPSIIMLVPLILEGVHSKILKKAREKTAKYLAFKALLFISGVLYSLGIDIRKKFFKTVHESLGGNLRLVIAGAAAMSPKISHDIQRMGINVRQGYGLTECSPIVCVNRETDVNNASVGPAMPGVEIKINNPNEDGVGEILVKGKNVMLGYYKDPEATAEVLRDGWFYTGDLGRMDKKGRLYICGRIKNIIVTKTGKNIYPEELEEKIKHIPYVLESIVWGYDNKDDGDTEVHATVVPNYEAIKEAGFDDTTPDAVKALIWNEIKKVNKTVPVHKAIKEVHIREEEFEKTTTRKIKRYVEKFIKSDKGNVG